VVLFCERERFQKNLEKKKKKKKNGRDFYRKALSSCFFVSSFSFFRIVFNIYEDEKVTRSP
jgi:hypothetical protein